MTAGLSRNPPLAAVQPCPGVLADPCSEAELLKLCHASRLSDPLFRASSNAIGLDWAQRLQVPLAQGTQLICRPLGSQVLERPRLQQALGASTFFLF